MNTTINQKGDSQVAIVESTDILISNVQDALDLMASVQYLTGCDKFIINQWNLTEDFFELKTKLAGDVLQKYTNYHMKMAVIGEFDQYDSKSLRDFIYECNHGKQFFFVADEQAALDALHGVK
ncbi:DUF4180 domain-containing protein [Paenibacillus sp. Soil750]|uniref:DUF4180 domain-containing protein n=1 Tax=Paenibacillus sp. Soil750 TaxID=1736398 RepID=UPI000700EBB1|nr:DUF4180 domain-containing protein [Paenibacillus sp. Soil750]KRE58364.1 cytoplasmic protein [Paenibacillus sp. Soil750]